MSAYQKLTKTMNRISNLSHVSAILGWDEATMMSAGGGEARAEALTEITTLVNETLLKKELLDWVGEAKAETLNDWERANLREIEREILRVHHVDPQLTEQITRQRFRSEQMWRQLRPQNNYKEYLPEFNQLVELVREEAKQRGQAQGLRPYDALTDLYNSGGRSATYKKVFDQLRAVLPEMIQFASQRQHPLPAQTEFVPMEKQRQLGEHVMKTLRFDFSRGRLDVSVHPFCGGVPQDVRITTRYDERDWTESLMGVIHETGHASYEQGLPKAFLNQPVGRAMGMSIHESQSLFFEMQIGRSQQFLNYLSPMVQKVFNRSGDPLMSAKGLARVYHRVKPGFIRVSADEMTYPCHIILRFEIEQALVEGKIECADLPEIWDQKMQELLGLSTQGNDKDGVMQDVHWPSAAFGYFPCYTFGALIAAQLAHRLKQDIKNFSQLVEGAQLEPICQWLHDHVWRWGCYYSTDDLIQSATGEPLNTKYFIEHLKERYLS